MAESVALWGRDIDESSADLDATHVSDGPRDPITEPIPVVSQVSDGYGAQLGPDDEPVIDRRPSANSTLTFKPAPAPWYRTRRGLIVLIGVIAVAAVLAIVPMLLRTPGPGSELPTNVTPTTGPAPSSAPPTTGSVAPTLTSRPAPPPAPPPPPPPAPSPPAQDAPVYTRQYPAPGGSAPRADEPQIGVTRAPISVAPKPVTPPSTAEVGDNGGDSTPRRRWHW
jgi:hypothetical protein